MFILFFFSKFIIINKLIQNMDGYPVTIILLDPPLHEFLPKTDKDIAELTKEIN